MADTMKDSQHLLETLCLLLMTQKFQKYLLKNLQNSSKY